MLIPVEAAADRHHGVAGHARIDGEVEGVVVVDIDTGAGDGVAVPDIAVAGGDLGSAAVQDCEVEHDGAVATELVATDEVWLAS